MTRFTTSRWAVDCTAILAALLAGLAFTARGQQRVQSTTQLTVRPSVAADPLAEWRARYAEAIQVTREVAASGSPDLAERVELDLEAMDEVLQEYVRVSERLRHRDRALVQSIQSLNNAAQMDARRYETLANALRAAQDVGSRSIRNTRQ